MSEGTASSVIAFFVSAACATFLVALSVEVKSCNQNSDRATVEMNAAKQRSLQACIASTRPAAECALLVGGAR